VTPSASLVEDLARCWGVPIAVADSLPAMAMDLLYHALRVQERHFLCLLDSASLALDQLVLGGKSDHLPQRLERPEPAQR